MNFKRKKGKYTKGYRNGTDGRNCGYCGSNWKYKTREYFQELGREIKEGLMILDELSSL